MYKKKMLFKVLLVIGMQGFRVDFEFFVLLKLNGLVILKKYHNGHQSLGPINVVGFEQEHSSSCVHSSSRDSLCQLWNCLCYAKIQSYHPLLC